MVLAANPHLQHSHLSLFSRVRPVLRLVSAAGHGDGPPENLTLYEWRFISFIMNTLYDFNPLLRRFAVRKSYTEPSLPLPEPVSTNRSYRNSPHLIGRRNILTSCFLQSKSAKSHLPSKSHVARNLLRPLPLPPLKTKNPSDI